MTYTLVGDKHRNCFCIGADKCKDKTCPFVRNYIDKQKESKNKSKGRVMSEEITKKDMFKRILKINKEITDKKELIRKLEINRAQIILSLRSNSSLREIALRSIK